MKENRSYPFYVCFCIIFPCQTTGLLIHMILFCHIKGLIQSGFSSQYTLGHSNAMSKITVKLDDNMSDVFDNFVQQFDVFIAKFDRQ